MNLSGAADLRNSSEKKGIPIRKNDPLDVYVFRREWQFRLRRRGLDWEGPRAVAELQRKGMYEFVSGDTKGKTDWHFEDLLSRMIAEMKAYRLEAAGKLLKEHFDEVEEWLERLVERIRVQESKIDLPEVIGVVQDLRKEVERSLRTVRRLRREKEKWRAGVWPRLWPEVPRRKFVQQTIELDRRLQIELGKMLADYLRPQGVKLETIARLILLAYRTGELASVDGTDMRTHDTHRILRVRTIRDRLTYAGLNKARSFRKRHSVF